MSQIKAKAKTRRGFLKGEWEKAEVTQGVKEGFSIAKHSDGDGDLSLFDSKVALATEGLQPYFEKMLRIKVSKQNALTISEYINSLRREINLSMGL